MVKRLFGTRGNNNKKMIVLILSTMFVFCACDGKGKTTEEPQIQNQKKTTEEPQEQGETAEVDSPYQVNMVQGTRIKDGNIDVVYPQIEGWENSQAQERWNEMLNFDFKKDQDGPGIEECKSYKVKTTIMTQRDDLLSILVEGSTHYEGEEYPYRWAHAYSINMSTGESYGLGDCSDEELQQITLALLREEYTVKSSYKAINLEAIAEIEELFAINQGEEAVSLDERRINKKLKKCEWELYRKDDIIGLVFDTIDGFDYYVILEIVCQ